MLDPQAINLYNENMLDIVTEERKPIDNYEVHKVVKAALQTLGLKYEGGNDHIEGIADNYSDPHNDYQVTVIIRN